MRKGFKWRVYPRLSRAGVLLRNVARAAPFIYISNFALSFPFLDSAFPLSSPLLSSRLVSPLLSFFSPVASLCSPFRPLYRLSRSLPFPFIYTLKGTRRRLGCRHTLHPSHHLRAPAAVALSDRTRRCVGGVSAPGNPPPLHSPLPPPGFGFRHSSGTVPERGVE